LREVAEEEAYEEATANNGRVRFLRELQGTSLLNADLLLKKSTPETDLSSPNWWSSIVECSNKIRN
jgi:hypothetical protein